MGTRTTCLGRGACLGDRVRQLGWLVLWLVARHSLRVWLTAPASTGAETLIQPKPVRDRLTNERAAPRLS